MKLLWLDDIRDPFKGNWLVFSPIPLDELREVIWVKNYESFIQWITNNGLPDGICFDHDLSDFQSLKGSGYLDDVPVPEHEKTGYDCAKWLVEYCTELDHPLPKWNSQSANPVGKENINSLLNNFKKFYDSR